MEKRAENEEGEIKAMNEKRPQEMQKLTNRQTRLQRVNEETAKRKKEMK